MSKISPNKLGQLVSRKRGSMGIRAAAKEIGTSPATLSRIEHGHVADFKTMTNILTWVGIDPRDFFGYPHEADINKDIPKVQIAFKKNKAVQPATAQALANLIMAAHKSFEQKINNVAGH